MSHIYNFPGFPITPFITSLQGYAPATQNPFMNSNMSMPQSSLQKRPAFMQDDVYHYGPGKKVKLQPQNYFYQNLNYSSPPQGWASPEEKDFSLPPLSHNQAGMYKKVRLQPQNCFYQRQDFSSPQQGWASPEEKDFSLPLQSNSKADMFSFPQLYHDKTIQETSDSETSSKHETKIEDHSPVSQPKIEEKVPLSIMRPAKIEEAPNSNIEIKINTGKSKKKAKKERFSIVEKPALVEFTEAFPEWGIEAIFDFFKSGKDKDEFYRERKAHGKRYKK